MRRGSNNKQRRSNLRSPQELPAVASTTEPLSEKVSICHTAQVATRGCQNREELQAASQPRGLPRQSDARQTPQELTDVGLTTSSCPGRRPVTVAPGASGLHPPRAETAGYTASTKAVSCKERLLGRSLLGGRIGVCRSSAVHCPSPSPEVRPFSRSPGPQIARAAGRAYCCRPPVQYRRGHRWSA